MTACAGRERPFLWLAIGGLGVSAAVTQLVLMRELLTVFCGNELVFGIALGDWLLLTGLGSYLGRFAGRARRPVDWLLGAQVAVAILPIAQVFLLRVLHNAVFVRGAEVGLPETVAACFLVLAPCCLVIGFLLTLGSIAAATRDEAGSIGQVYFLDNMGSVAGGLAFTFVLVSFLGHFGILYVAALASLLLAGLAAWAFRRRVLLGAAVAAGAAVAIVAAAGNLDAISTRVQYPGQRILYRGNSPYGSLLVTETAGQLNFISSGVILFSSQNVAQVEETVHFAMAQRPNAERVLLISGGVSGTAREILKYPKAEVDYVELDPLVLRKGREYLPQSLADKRIHAAAADGRRFVRATAQRYDVVLVDVPDPSTFQINRFYTREFFGEVRRRMTADGVLCLGLGHYENRLSPELADLIAVAHRTLSEQFGRVQMIPAGRVYFLASDGPLTPDVAPALERAGIRTRYVRRNVLSGIVTKERIEALQRAVRPEAPVNTDFSPILYYYHLRYWMSQFQVGFGLLEAGLLMMLLVALVRLRPVTFAIFASGLAASALEVVLLMGFQILYGYVYQQVGLIVAMFMLGLGIGSYLATRFLDRLGRRHLAWLGLAIAAYGACLPWALAALSELGGSASAVVAPVAIPGLAVALAVLVGAAFPLAAKADFRTVGSTAARVYWADYLGSALGALLVSTLLIPVLGVASVCLLTAGLNVASSVVLMGTSRR